MVRTGIYLAPTMNSGTTGRHETKPVRHVLDDREGGEESKDRFRSSYLNQGDWAEGRGAYLWDLSSYSNQGG